jgi:hypothetical protein
MKSGTEEQNLKYFLVSCVLPQYGKALAMPKKKFMP